MSVGIVVHGSGRATPDEILRDADTAMYMAKQRGGAGYVVFGAEMGGNASVQLQLRADLRRAVAAQSLALRYQPILRLSDGSIAGFEALLRWEHPERGAVDPMEFIPAAESTGLILPLGCWALTQACRTAASWQTDRASAVPISVNLSARQLQRSDFLSSLEAVLRETALPASALVLELTESALFAHSEPVVRALEGIRALGISLHIDDFGTGYSSLNYLARLPVTALKVDRSFVQGLGRDEGSRKILRGVVTLAHSLGIDVIAEGIETAAQLRLLRDELGCDFGQGYLYARALEADEAFSCLVRQPWRCGPRPKTEAAIAI